MLLILAGLAFIGWMLNPAIRLVLPSLKLTNLQTFFVSISLSTISNCTMALNAFVLYSFRHA
jgi:hypothetical protein